MDDLTLDRAQELINAALASATEHGWLISAAVIDRHGNLVAFARQDGSTLASGLSAQSKAWTAAAIGASTSDLQPLTAPGQPLHGLPHAAGPNRPITPVPGGIPIHATDETLLGGIGIGGAPAPTDDDFVAVNAILLHSRRYPTAP
ncbi:GlcG/HbpS family heme-binding protein [Microbacterium paulum]